jgi:Fe-S-cluster containining protein
MADCIKCKGACCEEFLIPLGPVQDDTSRWFYLHGDEIEEGQKKFLRFECKCTKLGEDGLCTIYSDRPNVCRTFLAGGAECRAALKRRRTPEQIKEILGQ